MKTRHFYVYVHTNIFNHKRYVGQTKQDNPEDRWDEGKGYRGNEHFWRAIQVYGWNEGFTHFYYEVSSKKEMDAEEKRLIALFDSMDQEKGYNHTTGGDSPEFSKESRQKMSDSHSDVPLAAEHKQHISDALSNVPKSEEHRKHLSEASTGKKMSDDARKNMSDAKKGTVESDETKQKISVALKGITKSASTRKKMSDARKKRPTKFGISETENPKEYAKCLNARLFTDGTTAVKWTTLRNWIYRGVIDKATWKNTWKEVKDN